MKHQALFSSKDKSKKLKCCLLQFLFGALRVKLIQKTGGIQLAIGSLYMSGILTRKIKIQASVNGLPKYSYAVFEPYL